MTSDAPLRGCFVTGTDTGVGKTWIAAGLLRALNAGGRRAVGMKPVASGCAPTPAGLRSDDALRLAAESWGAPEYRWVNPYAFEPPVAPHLAAREAGVEISFAPIEAAIARLAVGADFVVVEGVGGWRVPLGAHGDVAALAARLGLPVVLVIGLRLGCINHARLTAEAIRTAGMTLAGWVGDFAEPAPQRLEGNLETLRECLPAPCLGVVPRLAAFDAAAVAAHLELPRGWRGSGAALPARGPARGPAPGRAAPGEPEAGGW